MKTQDLPRARAYLQSALTALYADKTHEALSHIVDALSWMKKTPSKRGVRRNRTTALMLTRLRYEMEREDPDRPRQDVEIAEAAGYTAAAAARVSEIRNGLR